MYVRRNSHINKSESGYITLHFYTFVDSSTTNGLDPIKVTLTLKCKDSNINTNRYIQRSHYASN